MTNIQRFQMTLYTNRNYVRLINEKAPAEVQAKALKKCEHLMNSILKLGLANEYAEYCRREN